MRELLTYSIDDRLYVEATLSNSNNHGNFTTITLRLQRRGHHGVIAKKKFLWPERTLPLEIAMDDQNKVLIMKGIANIARISLSIRPEKYALFVGTSESSASSVPVFSSLLLSSQAETAEDSDIVWARLSKLVKRCASLDSLPVGITSHEQMALIKVLRKHVGEKHFDRMLSFLIKSRLITSTKVSCKLIELLASRGLVSQLLGFVRCSLFLDDLSYSTCLKMLANQPGTGKSCLLLALLEKPVNSSGGLRRAISQNLTEFEVATLIERLIFFIYEKESEQTLDKVLNLLRVLIDSHSLRFIWDEQCHEKLQKAASVVTDLVQVLDLFCRLERRLDQNRNLTDTAHLNSDYIIRKISFVPKRI